MRVKDKSGSDWKLPAFSVGLALRLRDDAEFDILSIRGNAGEDAGKAAGRLVGQLYDPFTLGAVCWVLFAAEARERGLDEVEFADVFTAEEYPALREAILSAVLDFTLPPSVAIEVKAALPGVIGRAEAAMAQAWRNSHSDSADTLGSIPVP